jgi:hypothetical protein
LVSNQSCAPFNAAAGIGTVRDPVATLGFATPVRLNAKLRELEGDFGLASSSAVTKTKNLEAAVVIFSSVF